MNCINLGVIIFHINSFVPEPPVTARADPRLFHHLWRHHFLMVKDTFAANLCRVKRSFKQYQNEHNSVKKNGEKGKKPGNIDLKISMKILFHYLPTFPFI